jgi:hypothetical protein
VGVFQQTIKNFAPPWFLKRNMGTLLEAVGATYDVLAQRVFDGRRAGNPFAGGADAARTGASRTDAGVLRECDTDALPYHARDRQIRLYSTEPILSQRIRLSQWHQIHKARASHWGEISNVRPYFATASAYPNVAVVFQNNAGTPGATWYEMTSGGAQYVRTASPSNFNYDGQPSERTRFWFFLDLDSAGFSTPWTSDSGHTYDSGGVYDVGSAPAFTAAAAADVVAMIQEAQAAHSWLAGVVAWWPMTGGAAFPSYSGTPTQDASGWWSLPHGANTWASLVDPSTGKATRPPNMSWIYDNPSP